MFCGAGIWAQIYQSLHHSATLWCLCFHISVKPLWESRLHQLCLGQPSKMGWVHALARVLENLTDGGWLGSRGEGRESRWKWDTLSPSRKGFLMLNLENDEFYGSLGVDKLTPEARIWSPFSGGFLPWSVASMAIYDKGKAHQKLGARTDLVKDKLFDLG